MLTREAIGSAFALTEKVDSAGLVIRPVENTPLWSLVAASRGPGDLLIDTSHEYCPDISLIDHMANTPLPGMEASQHDIVMDEVVQVVVDAIRGHMVHARTVVAPLVDSLASAVRQALEDQSASSLLGMEVVIVETPVVLTNPVLTNAANQFAPLPYDPPSLNVRLGSMTAEQIRDTMSAGTARLDNDVNEWLAAKGEGWLCAMYERVFQSGSGEASPGDSFQRVVNEVDNALFVFLMARKLYDATPPEGTEMGLKVYEQAMVEFRNQSGKQLSHFIETYQTDVKNGNLVVYNTDNTIGVHSEVYRSWIEAGGTNEVLYGNLLSRPVLTTVSSINENATALLANWNKHSVYVTSAEANRRFERTKQFMSLSFHRQLAEDTDETNLGNAEQVFQRFLDELDCVREGELDCLDTLALRLVCKSRYPHTSAFDILDGINTAKRANPALDIREAAAISMAKYIGTWVASQFTASV